MQVIYLCPGMLLREGAVYEGCDAQKKIADIAKNFEVIVGDGITAPDDMLGRIEIIMGTPNVALLKKLPALRWLHLSIAGSDRYCDRSLYAGENVLLTNSSGVFGQPISEYIIGMFLALSRGFHLYRDEMMAGTWSKRHLSNDFAGSTVAVIGMGDIGGSVAKKAHALGAHVVAIKNNVGEKPDYVDELYGADMLDEVISRSDFISLSLPNTKNTQHFIAKKHFDLMKKNAIIVNVGRGTAIDQDALAQALANERIFAAGLDVTTPEPLPKEHPLWQEKRCLITAHNSGASNGNAERILDIFTDNLEKYINGSTLENVVDMESGY